MTFLLHLQNSLFTYPTNSFHCFNLGSVTLFWIEFVDYQMATLHNTEAIAVYPRGSTEKGQLICMSVIYDVNGLLFWEKEPLWMSWMSCSTVGCWAADKRTSDGGTVRMRWARGRRDKYEENVQVTCLSYILRERAEKRHLNAEKLHDNSII